MEEKINSKVDTLEVDTEIKNLEKELKKAQVTKFKLMDEIDSLDTENKHYKKIKSDLDYRLYRMYDKIEEIESNILDARTKKEVLQANKLTGDNIYRVLIYFDKLFKLMDERERRKLITSLVESIQVFEEKQPNGQWLKSIEFKLPIIEEDMEISLDKNEHVETMCLMSRKEK